MKRNKLYKVNRFNYPVVTSEGNLYSVGGFLKGIGDKVGNFMGGSEIAGSPIGGLAGVASNAVGKLLSGGRSSTAGNIISGIGGAVSTANPILGAGITLAGHALNFAIGTKVDQEKLNAAMSGTDALRNYTSTASSFDDIQGPEAMAKVENPYSGGIGGSSERKNNELRRQRADALAWAERGIDNNIQNLSKSQADSAAANYSAFGGAIDYGFMQDYLTNKKREAEYRNKIGSLTQIPSFMPQNTLALGGDLQTHGGDFSDGLTIINAGLSHEENPNEGVQLGVDSQNVPNLVEEGETVFNDYVFSNRILADDATKQMFRLPRKNDYTFADISKRLEKEISERPNDPVSKRGFEKQLQMLEEQQERQKQEMEAARAKAAFDALSPEEQVAVIQQLQQEEQMAQQAAMQEDMTEQAASGNAVQDINEEYPGEQFSDEQQLAQLQNSVSALGGRLVRAGDVVSKFAAGGKKGSRNARRIAKRYDAEWFSNMAKSLGMSEDDMSNFVYNAEDPEANIANFNSLYRDYQYKKALDTYKKGQRQSKKNELFGDRGMYTYADNKSHIYKARVNDKDRTGWINNNYTGEKDADGNMIGFLTQEAYDKLKPEEKEAYRRINEKAGNWMYDAKGHIIRDLYNGTEDDILNSFNEDYAKGFKWDDKDAQTVQYPVELRHSPASNMRYIPAIGGAIGLFHDILSPADYSRAIAIQRLGNYEPTAIRSNYNPSYMTYRPLDIWYGGNRLTADSRGTDRAILNSGAGSGAKVAGLVANGYRTVLGQGNMFRQGQEYNDALAKQVIGHNSGENRALAQFDMQAQLANQNAAIQSAYNNARYNMLGYQMMDNIDARRNASINANATNILQSLGNIGEEAYDRDYLRWLEGTGVLKSNTLNSNGGKIKRRKKGLTI